MCKGRPGRPDAAIEMLLRSASSGGVGAKIASSPACRICRATNLDRMFGLMSSPLFTSTHLTVTGAFPVCLLHSSTGFSCQTSFPSKYSSSLARAALTSSGFSSCPVRSSLNVCSPSTLDLQDLPRLFVNARQGSTIGKLSVFSSMPTNPSWHTPSFCSCLRNPTRIARQSLK